MEGDFSRQQAADLISQCVDIRIFLVQIIQDHSHKAKGTKGKCRFNIFGGAETAVPLRRRSSWR